MNPQTVRKPHDRAKIYNEYIASLQAQTALLDRTAQAVSVLQQTGQAPVQPTDTRTMTQKSSRYRRPKDGSPTFTSYHYGRRADRISHGRIITRGNYVFILGISGHFYPTQGEIRRWSACSDFYRVFTALHVRLQQKLGRKRRPSKPAKRRTHAQHAANYRLAAEPTDD